MACEHCKAARMSAIESLNLADLLLTILRREGVATAEQKLLKTRLDSCYERFSKLESGDSHE